MAPAPGSPLPFGAADLAHLSYAGKSSSENLPSAAIPIHSADLSNASMNKDSCRYGLTPRERNDHRISFAVVVTLNSPLMYAALSSAAFSNP